VASEADSAPVAELAEPPAPPPAPTKITCPSCGTVSPLSDDFCGDCGYYFSASDRAAASAVAQPGATAAPVVAPAPAPAASLRVQDRYELVEKVSEWAGVERFRALDHGEGGPAVAVTVIRQPLPEPAPPAAEPALLEPEPVEPSGEEELRPTLDDDMFADLVPAAFPATAVLSNQPVWPSIAWERRLLRSLETPGLPAERAYFSDDTHEYLVEEVPTGQLLWDA